MKFSQDRTASAPNLFRVAAAGLFVLVVCAAPAVAQRNGVFDRMRNERNDQQMREVQIKQREKLALGRPGDTAQPRLFYDQIREDFRRMQIVNNEMLQATFPDGVKAPRFDYERISKATAEINRRAARLKTNLQLPEPDEQQKETLKPNAPSQTQLLSGEQLKASLLALDGLIMSFVKNPTFHKSDIVDAEHSTRARLQLMKIVELSRTIKQSAERMKN